MSTVTMNGLVISVNVLKGYGFILGEDGVSRFFHAVNWTDEREQFDMIKPYRTRVEFEPDVGERGPRAMNVRREKR